MNVVIKSLCLSVITLCCSISAVFSQISFTADVSQGCAPLTVTFTNTSTVGSSFLWYFGDGSSGFSSDTDTTHIYVNPSFYTVSLYAYDSAGTYIGFNQMNIQADPPNNVFYMSATSACPGATVAFASYVSGSDFFWDFGDGDTASGQWVSHTYSTIGTYNVTFTMNSICGLDTIIQTLSVDSTGLPDANFGFWPSPACPNQPVSFYSFDQNGTSFYWDFGDGDTSTLEYPIHPYDSIGFFNITFIITNGCGNSDTSTQQIEVKDNTSWPPLSLQVNSPGCPGENLNTGAPAGYLAYVWDAGDGTPPDSSVNSYFNHIYTTVDTFYQSLTIYDYCGNDTTIMDTIVVGTNVGLPNQGWFQLQVAPSICPGQLLTVGAPGGFLAYVYDYGDGSPLDSMTWSNTPHLYANTGTYTVSVKIYNFCGNDSTLYATVLVDSNAGFGNGISFGYNSPICPGNANFGVEDGHLLYVWDYGDGSPLDSSTSANANHIYANTGTFPISVTVTNYCGNDTTLNGTMIVGNNIGFPNNMNLYAFPNPVCPGDRVSLNTDYGYQTYDWDFGDGNTVTTGDNYAEYSYDSLGVYNFSVKITNSCGLDTTLSAGVLVDANAPFPPQVQINVANPVVCPGDQVNFNVDDDWALFFWDFGGLDTVTTTARDITYVFDSVGTYEVQVTVWNGCGNQITLKKFIVVDSNNTFVDAAINTINNNICPGDQITIGPEAEDGTSHLYYWDFGDGSVDTSIGIGVNHTYDSVGVYTVTAMVTNGCGYSATSSLTITVSSTAVPSLGQGDDFYGVAGDGGIAGCAGDAILFYFAGLYTNTWDFGDGSSGSAVNSVQTSFGAFAIITHVYADTGTYWATLTITNSCGNSLTDSVMVIIGSGLAVSGELFTEAPIGGGAFTTCQGVGFLAMGGNSYDWDYGDGTTLTTTSSQTTHYYASAGTYLVSVTMTNACGNTGTYSIIITVIDGGGASGSVTVTGQLTCNGGSDAVATAAGTGGTLPYTFLWSDPAAQTTASASNLSAGTYTVTVSDNVGCTAAASVTVTDPPELTGTGSMTPASCAAADGSVSITSLTGGTAPYSFLWDNGDTTATADSLASGNYTVTVTDANGCVSTQAVTLNDVGGVTISGATMIDVTCSGGADGSVDITITGGTAPYTYAWSTGDTVEDISGLMKGTYTITVTDAAGCNTIETGSIDEASVIAVAPTVVDANCGVADGSIIAVASGGAGGYSYLWSNGVTSSGNTALVAGAYNLTVTDASSCQEVFTITVSNANAPAVSSVVTDISCNGAADGEIDLTVSGGTTPYTYLWLHDGSFTQDVSGLSAGSITMILYDGGGCQTAATYTIVEPDALTSTTAVTGAHCGYNDGSGMATVTGGTTPYTYLWSTGGLSSTESGLGTGTATLAVTDANGCMTTDSATITSTVDDIEICVVTVDSASTLNIVVWDKPSPAMGIESFNIYRDVVGTYTLIGNVPYNSLSEYEDTDVGVNPNSASEFYKISAVDSCTNEGNQSSFHKTINLAPVTISSGDATLIWDNYEGFNFAYYRIMRNITGQATDWVAIDSVTNLVFIKVDIAAPQVSDLNYRIDVVTNSTCVASKAKNFNSSKSNTSAVDNKIYMTSGMGTTNNTNADTCDGTASITVSSGTSPYTYVWGNGQTTSTATGLCAGSYDVTVFDADGDSLVNNTSVSLVPGFAEFDLNKYLHVYPNPNTGRFNISIKYPDLNLITVKVFTIGGQLVYDHELLNISGEVREELDLSKAGPGIYYIQVVSAKGTSVKKVVVQ